MRDDFRNDREEYMDLRPAQNDKKFSYHLWNNHVVPMCKQLIKLRKVNRLRAGFDSSQGKVYFITIWTDRGYDHGAAINIRPVSSGIVWHGRDLSDNTFFEGENWDSIVDTVENDVKVDASLLAHAR